MNSWSNRSNPWTTTSTDIHRLKALAIFPTALIIKNNLFLLNIENKDQECFACSVLGAIVPPSTHTKQDPEWYKKQLQRLDLTHKVFLVPLVDILKFELTNYLPLKVLGLEKKEIVSLFFSKK